MLFAAAHTCPYPCTLPARLHSTSQITRGGLVFNCVCVFSSQPTLPQRLVRPQTGGSLALISRVAGWRLSVAVSVPSVFCRYQVGITTAGEWHGGVFECSRRIRISGPLSGMRKNQGGGRVASIYRERYWHWGVGTQQMRVDIAHRGFLALSFARAHRRGMRCDCVRTWAEMRSSV